MWYYIGLIGKGPLDSLKPCVYVELETTDVKVPGVLELSIRGTQLF